MGAGTAPAMAVALPLGAPMTQVLTKRDACLTQFLTKRDACSTLRHELRGGRGLRHIY